MTVAEWSHAAAARLIQAGFPEGEARLDVSVLARHALGWDGVAWIVRSTDVLPPGTLTTLNALIQRRIRREPTAYITGEREFYGRPFAVTSSVLIPRPETEFAIDAALRLINERQRAGVTRPHVLDIGTGSGCIAVTLALEAPAIRVTATDISPAAIVVAQQNAVRHGVADRIDFINTELAAGFAHSVDVLVSNPPYVALADRETLAADVRDFEPALALFGGPNGLDVYDVLIPAAHAALVAGGGIVLEIGAGQARDVTDRLTRAGFEGVVADRDLAGHQRILSARCKGEVDAPDGARSSV